jgi:hypothetical protein
MTTPFCVTILACVAFAFFADRSIAGKTGLAAELVAGATGMTDVGG